jgi:hypothetical protein
MILKEGDKVKKKEDGTVFNVRKVHDKGFVILSSEDGARAILMNLKDMDLHFSMISSSVTKS